MKTWWDNSRKFHSFSYEKDKIDGIKQVLPCLKFASVKGSMKCPKQTVCVRHQASQKKFDVPEKSRNSED